MKVIGILILVFGLLLTCGGSFFAVRSYGVTDPMGQCSEAARAMEKADAAVRDLQWAKGTPKELEAKKKAADSIGGAESAERFCAEMKQIVRHNTITAGITAGVGFVMSLIGIGLILGGMRSKKKALP